MSPPASDLEDIHAAPLRAVAAEARERGEEVKLLVGAQGTLRVETLVFEASRRAAQSTGAAVVWGTWSGERLMTDAGAHMLDVDGSCFCRDCETAGGFCVDDDE